MSEAHADKVISEPGITAEKMIVLENADAVLKKATYTGSAQITERATGGTDLPVQHDYFETPVSVAGEKYTAKFDVAATPGNPNGGPKNVVKSVEIVRGNTTKSTPDRNYRSLDEEYQRNVDNRADEGYNGNNNGGHSPLGTYQEDSEVLHLERGASHNVNLLDEYIKSNKLDKLPLSSGQILKATYGDLQLAKNVVVATKEVILGKTLVELVDSFKLPYDPTPGSLSTYQTRIWYKWQESMFEYRLDYSKPLKEVAKDAFDMRNEARAKARESMSDRALAEALIKNDDNWTFDDFIEYKKSRKGLSGDDIWKDIINSATRSRDNVDRLFGLLEVM